jgi:hypothetical protein
MSKRWALAVALLLLLVLIPSALSRSSPRGVAASDHAMAKSAPAIVPTPSSALLGTWVNTDFSTNNTVRIQLFTLFGSFYVHGWGACSPSPCNWGTVSGRVYSTGTTSSVGVAFTATYTFSFKQTIVTGYLAGPYLIVQTYNHFTDGSARYDYYTTERFVKKIRNVEWGAGPAIPSPHIEAASAAILNRVYVISGGVTDCTDVLGGPPSAKVDIYNTFTNAWVAGPSVNIARDMDPLAAYVGGKIYLIGGTARCGGDTVRTVEVLNPLTNTWTMLPSTSNLPSALTGNNHCGAAVGSRIYYFQGGGIGVFDTSTLSWKVLPAGSLLTAAAQFCRAAPLLNGKIMITGAGTGSPGTFDTRVLIFDPATGIVSKAVGTTMNLAEHAMGSLYLLTQVVVAGGDYSNETGVQLLTPGFVENLGLLPSARHDPVTAVVGTRMYILGGVSGANLNPGVLIGAPSF